MSAILVTLNFKYVCNPDYKRFQIWVQSFLVGTRKSRRVLLTLISGQILSRGTFQCLHSYMFLTRKDYSHICPICNQDCTYIWMVQLTLYKSLVHFWVSKFDFFFEISKILDIMICFEPCYDSLWKFQPWIP